MRWRHSHYMLLALASLYGIAFDSTWAGAPA